MGVEGEAAVGADAARGDEDGGTPQAGAGALRVRRGDGRVEEVAFSEGATLLEALRGAGVVVLAPCGGGGTCGRCEVTLADEAAPDGTRTVLACQTPAADGAEVVLDDLAALVVEEGFGDAGAGAGRDRADAPDGPSGHVGADAYATPSPADVPGGRYGLAVDIGTTTLALYLVDLATLTVLETTGALNPQAPFGADVIARIDAARDPASAAALRDGVREAIADAAAALCARRGIDPAALERVTCAGNTVMECLAASVDPAPLGVAPFTPPTLFGYEADLTPPAPEAAPAAAGASGSYAAAPPAPTAPDRGACPAIPALAHAYLAPAVAAYVGGDITAGLHAAGMRDRRGLQLFVDIGTNGEMALGDAGRVVCCATAAGPAFEGAGIGFGMPALPGAIEAVTVEDGRLTSHVIGGGPARGLCGSGLLDAVACLLDAGLIDESGYLLDADEARDEAPEALAASIGEEDGQTVCYLDPARRVWLSQADVRQTQLAKAAIRAGIEVLMASLGVTADDVDELALAGGFGTRLRARSAARIGLIPPALAERTRPLGNAAGQGAVAALADEGRAALEAVARACEYRELSGDAAFNDAYIEAMGFEEETA